MTTLNRLLTICILLSAFATNSTTGFAVDLHEALASSNNAVISQVKERTEPSSDPGIDFGSLFMPQPKNRSCTASSDCSVTGGSPISCTGSSSCTFIAFRVTCDNQTTYCSCVPQNLTFCSDAISFCSCYNVGHQYVSCWRSYCG